jgi:dye decolorizing peroxidase
VTEEGPRESAEKASNRGLSRRAFGGLVTAGTGAILGGALVKGLSPSDGRANVATDNKWDSNPHGATQAGVARPVTPHPHALVSSFSLPENLHDGANVRDLADALANLGNAIINLTSANSGEIPFLPDGPESMAATVGIGPRIARMIDRTGAGTTDLPEFAGDDSIPPQNRGGDILLCVYSTSPSNLTAVTDFLISEIPGAELRWRQAGTRGPGTGTIARNTLGFHDGVIVPRGDSELAENVWIRSGRYEGGTILVIRRLRLDLRRWNSQSEHVQERTIGRRKVSGSPLSGGKPTGPVDLQSKTPEGEYLIPARSHVRAAHPSFTGSHLMLRRGFIFDNGSVDGQPDAGLLFMAYQNDLSTFSRTQLRLDTNDDLMQFGKPTASATFLILPGFTVNEPLGKCLLDA